MTSTPFPWYALDQDTDVSGISGTGRVAYALHLPMSGVLMLWDTSFSDPTAVDTTARHSEGIEWLPDLPMLRTVACYGGRTRLVPIGDDPAAVARAEELLAAAYQHLDAAFAQLVPLFDDNLRQQERDRRRGDAVWRAMQVAKSTACQTKQHRTCLGPRLAMNSGFGCLCTCHDGEPAEHPAPALAATEDAQGAVA